MTVPRITHDAEADAAYVALAARFDDDGLFTTRVVQLDAGGPVLLELDALGRLVGVEVLQAGRTLPPELLLHLQRPDTRPDPRPDEQRETDRGPA